MSKKTNILLGFLSLMLLLPLTVKAQPKYEVRAAWVTTAYGLDWPRTRATSPATMKRQQQELIEILDKLKAAHFNTVLFQARTRGDVLYRSDIEPMNSVLTGKKYGDPGYDPLAFAVEECHKRGMECHAWMVTLPLGNRKHVNYLGARSVTKTHRNICVPYGRQWYLNAGNPETKEYLMSLVREVVTRYDVDGVHFDFLRYPEHARRFPDSYDYNKRSRLHTPFISFTFTYSYPPYSFFPKLLTSYNAYRKISSLLPFRRKSSYVSAPQAQCRALNKLRLQEPCIRSCE